MGTIDAFLQSSETSPVSRGNWKSFVRRTWQQIRPEVTLNSWQDAKIQKLPLSVHRIRYEGQRLDGSAYVVVDAINDDYERVLAKQGQTVRG